MDNDFPPSGAFQFWLVQDGSDWSAPLSDKSGHSEETSGRMRVIHIICK